MGGWVECLIMILGLKFLFFDGFVLEMIVISLCVVLFFMFWIGNLIVVRVGEICVVIGVLLKLIIDRFLGMDNLNLWVDV